MEEEEIQSYASPEGEPQSPPGQITVTVAAPAPQSTAITKFASPVTPSHQSHLTLALPIQHTTRPMGSSSGGREDCWSEGATSVLIDAWGERYTELSRGNLKQKHWKEVADIVSSREEYTKTPKTDIQCKNRIDTVKKKYKVEKAKVSSGCGPSHWPFFERLDRLLSPPATVTTTTASAVASAGGINSQKAVPMAIPVGVRPLPLPGLPHYPPHHHLKIPPHLQPQLQPPPPPPPQPPQLQQQFRQNNFPTFPSMFNKFNNSVNNTYNINNNNKPQIKRGPPPPPPVDSESDQEEGWSQGSADSLPPLERKRPKVDLNGLGDNKVKENKRNDNGKRGKARKGWGDSVRELTRAILKFGEAYEAAESAKLKQIVEIEKQRMKFAKELELQRMKFFMKTQLELSQLNNNNGGNNSDGGLGEGSSGKGGGGGGVGGSNHHNHHSNHRSQALSDASD